MPELPDITVYIEALERCILGQLLQSLRVASPFLLRTVDPPKFPNIRSTDIFQWRLILKPDASQTKNPGSLLTLVRPLFFNIGKTRR